MNQLSTYPDTTPIKMGMMAMKPRPRTVARMVTIRVNMEMVMACPLVMPWTGSMKPLMFRASGASSRPMMATMDPMAAGGNSTSIQLVPIFFTMSPIRMKQSPKAMKPPWASP